MNTDDEKKPKSRKETAKAQFDAALKSLFDDANGGNAQRAADANRMLALLRGPDGRSLGENDPFDKWTFADEPAKAADAGETS